MPTAAKRKTTERAPFRTSFLEEAEKLGLVGCLSGPSDLARNRRKYLRDLLRARAGRSR